jgi:hypothetical protein
MKRRFTLTPPKRATEQKQSKPKKISVKTTSRVIPEVQTPRSPARDSSSKLESPSFHQRRTSDAAFDVTGLPREELLERYAELAGQYSEALSQREELMAQEIALDHQIAHALHHQVAIEQQIQSKAQSSVARKASTT